MSKQPIILHKHKSQHIGASFFPVWGKEANSFCPLASKRGQVRIWGLEGPAGGAERGQREGQKPLQGLHPQWWRWERVGLEGWVPLITKNSHCVFSHTLLSPYSRSLQAEVRHWRLPGNLLAENPPEPQVLSPVVWTWVAPMWPEHAWFSWAFSECKVWPELSTPGSWKLLP